MTRPIYTREQQISVTVERGSNDGVPEDFLRVNVWEAEPRGWTFYRYPHVDANVNYVARSALHSVMREDRKPLGGLYTEKPKCKCCGQDVPS